MPNTVAPQANIETATRKIMNAFFDDIQHREAVLEKGPEEIIRYFDDENLPVYGFSFYIQRLILTQLNGEEAQGLTPEKMMPKNEFKKQLESIAKENIKNFPQNSIQLTKDGKTYGIKQINDLIRDDVIGERTKMTRKKIFVLSLIFNLDYDQTQELLQKGGEEKSINFRDPYEVLLAYCLLDHTNVYANYTRLRERYENEKKDQPPLVTDEPLTQYCKKAFAEIKTENDLIGFVCSLPTRTLSKSAYEEFWNLYHPLYDLYYEESVSEEIDRQIKKDPDGYINLIGLILREKLLPRDELQFSKIARALFGTATLRKTPKDQDEKFNILKRRYSLTAKELQAIYNKKDEVQKSHIIILGFLLYVKSGAWEQAVQAFGTTTQDLKGVYTDFSNYINSKLERAGYNDFGLSNLLERFVARCLYTEDPIGNFKAVMLEK